MADVDEYLQAIEDGFSQGYRQGSSLGRVVAPVGNLNSGAYSDPYARQETLPPYGLDTTSPYDYHYTNTAESPVYERERDMLGLAVILIGVVVVFSLGK